MCRDIFLVTEAAWTIESKDSELALHNSERMSDSEGEPTSHSPAQTKITQPIYKTKSGATKKLPANKFILAKLPGEALRTFVIFTDELPRYISPTNRQLSLLRHMYTNEVDKRNLRQG